MKISSFHNPTRKLVNIGNFRISSFQMVNFKVELSNGDYIYLYPGLDNFSAVSLFREEITQKKSHINDVFIAHVAPRKTDPIG